MALREVCLIGEPVLRAVAAPVAQFDEDLATLIADMFETMYAAPGRGLAAPQVGVSSRVFVTDVTWKDGPHTPIAFVNPEVVAQAEDVVTGPEACLSIPERAFDVKRPSWVEARWQDADGAVRQARFEGPQAICFCHELDHLNGVLITDHGVER
ncbi:peptide deformylase [Cognatiyoonia sp. IB215182]|uniref:peptide deformylase n=1 Tax=Cognatiyoonia sp. IB215182 TaxID=3097353 RepID=UPI002A11686E|nr:peptide deformylase [Cognatiyoonia sp. IB215182]MDX8351887.1 peptide deformylase [Cognatiyoonia sp. IB215182]